MRGPDFGGGLSKSFPRCLLGSKQAKDRSTTQRRGMTLKLVGGVGALHYFEFPGAFALEFWRSCQFARRLGILRCAIKGSNTAH
ncbi:MAG: hypothetical protein RL230_2923 [Pseudomonadota bacterium]